MEWRATHRVDSIHTDYLPDIKAIKECYPHYFHGRSKDGCPVYYEMLGKVNIKRLKERGIDSHGLLRYYIYVCEYMWTVLEPDDEHGQVVSIMDVENVSISEMMGDAQEFLKMALQVMQSHYVDRCNRMFIVNAPFFFNMMWRVVSPLLNENTRKKISILGCSASEKRELLKYIDSDRVPEAYGGTGAPLGSAEEEQAYLQFVEAGPRRLAERMALQQQQALENGEPQSQSHSHHHDDGNGVTSASSASSSSSVIGDAFAVPPQITMSSPSSSASASASTRSSVLVKESASAAYAADNSRTNANRRMVVVVVMIVTISSSSRHTNCTAAMMRMLREHNARRTEHDDNDDVNDDDDAETVVEAVDDVNDDDDDDDNDVADGDEADNVRRSRNAMSMLSSRRATRAMMAPQTEARAAAAAACHGMPRLSMAITGAVITMMASAPRHSACSPMSATCSC